MTFAERTFEKAVEEDLRKMCCFPSDRRQQRKCGLVEYSDKVVMKQLENWTSARLHKLAKVEILIHMAAQTEMEVILK